MAKTPLVRVPGHHVSLSIRGPKDMFRKLEWENSSLATLTTDQADVAGYMALNAAITAWHLGDWTAAALDERCGWAVASAYFNEPLVNAKDLQKVMRNCSALVACQQMCAAAKHMTITTPTYREGYRAFRWVEIAPADGLAALSSNPLLSNRLIDTIGVEFPEERDGTVTRQQTSSIGALLGDAMQWWEQTLRGLDLWDDEPCAY